MAKKTLPTMIPQIMTMIKQPNRVTNARYDYTLQQQKAFFIILREMQDYMDAQLKNPKGSLQLALFNPGDKSIEIRLPLKSITKKPYEYKELIKTFDELRKVSIQFPYKDEKGISYVLHTGLIERFALPDAVNQNTSGKKKYRKDIIIWINKGMAEQLVKLDAGYTRFQLEVAMSAKCKYTPRIYQLISKWKDKGVYIMKIEEFREWLVLEDKYQEYKDLKKWILNPVYNELFQKADVWFDFERIMEGKTVSALKFTILSNETLKAADAQRDNVVNMLKLHFFFTSADVDKIRYIIDKPQLVPHLYTKLIDLHEYLSTNKGIVDRPAYTLTTLKNAFKNRG